MLDRSDKVCVVARGDGAVDVINIEAEHDSVRSKGSAKPRKGSQSRSKDTYLEIQDQNGRKRLHSYQAVILLLWHSRDWGKEEDL